MWAAAAASKVFFDNGSRRRWRCGRPGPTLATTAASRGFRWIFRRFRSSACAPPQRFQERTHFRLAWRTPQVRRCLCLLAAAAALISTNEWRRGACHSRIKPLLAACVCAVGMWATRLRCPSEAAYPQPAGDSAVGSAAPGGGSGGRLNRFVDKSAAARRMAPSVRLAVGLGLGSGGALRGRGRRVRAAERGPIDADGDAMVLQPIDQCVDQGLLVEQIVPLGKVEVGDDGGGAVVALIHQTEEGVGLFGLEGQVAELVNEERTITAHLLEEFGGRPIGQGGVKLVQEGLGVIKTAAMAVQTGLPQQTHGQAGFAGSRLAYEQDV